MISRAQGLLTWAGHWRTLSAWRRDLSEVQVTISDVANPRRLGTCWPTEQRLVVYRGTSMIDELGTLVHELAHAACIGEDHGEVWQATFAAAVTEITGIAVTPCADNYEVLNMVAHDAMRAWWKSSGNAFAWKLASKGT